LLENDRSAVKRHSYFQRQLEQWNILQPEIEFYYFLSLPLHSPCSLTFLCVLYLITLKFMPYLVCWLRTKFSHKTKWWFSIQQQYNRTFILSTFLIEAVKFSCRNAIKIFFLHTLMLKMKEDCFRFFSANKFSALLRNF